MLMLERVPGACNARSWELPSYPGPSSTGPPASATTLVKQESNLATVQNPDVNPQNNKTIVAVVKRHYTSRN